MLSTATSISRHLASGAVLCLIVGISGVQAAAAVDGADTEEVAATVEWAEADASGPELRPAPPESDCPCPAVSSGCSGCTSGPSGPGSGNPWVLLPTGHVSLIGGSWPIPPQLSGLFRPPR